MYSAEVSTDMVASKIPAPSGYKLLIKPLEVKEKTESGIYMPDKLKSAEQTASVIGFVVRWDQILTATPTSSRMALTAKGRLRNLPVLFWDKI